MILRKIGQWAGWAGSVAAAVLLTCFAAWASGITIPAGASLNVNSGELRLDLVPDGSIYNAGTIQTTLGGKIFLSGDWTMAGSGVYLGITGGTVDFTAAAGTQSLIPAAASPDTFYNLTHSGAGALQLLSNPLRVRATLTNAAGTFDSTNQNINVGGDWVATSPMTLGTSVITFDGADQAIYGANAFYDLIKTVSSASQPTLTFEAGVAQTVSRVLTLRGFDASNYMFLRSSVSGTPAKLELSSSSGIQSLRFLDVKDNNACGPLDGSGNCTAITLVSRRSADGSAPALKNTNWLFNGATYTWDGSASDNWNDPLNWDKGLVPDDQDSVIIPVTANQPKLRSVISVQNLQINAGATLTLDQWSLNVLNTDTHDGTILLNGTIIIDGIEQVTADVMTDNGTVRYVGMQNGQAVVDMSSNFIIGGTARTTFHEIVINEENTTSLRDTFVMDTGFHILGDMTLTEGALTLADAKLLTVDADLMIYGGSLAATGSVTVNTDMSIYGGTFTSLGTTSLLTTGNDLNVSGGALNASAGSIDAGNVNMTSGTFTAPASGKTFTASGNFAHTAGTFTQTNGTLTLDGAAGSTQIVSGNTTFYGLAKAAPAGAASTITFASGQTQTVTGALTLTGVSGGSQLLIRATASPSQARLDLSAGGLQTISDVDVQDNYAGGLILVARGTSTEAGGNNYHWMFGTTALTWNGAVSVNWENPVNWDLGLVPAAGDDVTLALGAHQPSLTAVSGAAALRDLSIATNVVFSLGGYGLTVTRTFSNDGEVLATGSEPVGIVTPDIDSGTFRYVGNNAAGAHLLPLFNAAHAQVRYYNLIINAADAGYIFAPQADLSVYGSLTVNAGILDVTTLANKTLTAAGPITLNGGTLDVLNGNIVAQGDVVISGGTLSAPGSGKTFTVAGNWTDASATFIHNDGTVTFNGTSNPGPNFQAISGSTTFHGFVKQVTEDLDKVHYLTFAPGSTQTIEDHLTLTGATQDLFLRSTSTDLDPVAREWNILLKAGAQQTISKVDVADSKASGTGVVSLVARESPDHSVFNTYHNTNWIFGIPTLTWTGAVSVNWENPLNWDRGLVPIAGDDVVLAVGANQPSLTAGSGAVSLRDVSINVNAVLSLNGHGLTITRAFSNEGEVRATGAALETLNIAAPDIDSGTFRYIGDNTGTHPIALLDPGHAQVRFYNFILDDAGALDTFQPQADLSIYGSLTINVGVLDLPAAPDKTLTVGGSLTLNGGALGASNANIVANGNVVISGGTLTAPDASRTFTVNGSWTNSSGLFTANGGRVTFQGTADATVTGNTLFHDLSFLAPLGKNVYFTANSDQTVESDLVMSGGAANKLVLRSTASPTKWLLTVLSGAKTVTDVDVMDSRAVVSDTSGHVDLDIFALNSTDRPAGGPTSNEHWVFGRLQLIAPADLRITGPKPVLIGVGVAGQAVDIRDMAGNIIASTVGDANGNFRVAVSDANALALNVPNRLTPYFGVFAGNPSNILDVKAVPAATEVPQISSPVSGQRLNGRFPTVKGFGKPGEDVYVIAKDALGSLPLTLPLASAAGHGTVQSDGSFEVPLTQALSRGDNFLSVVVNGVSSDIITVILNDIYGVVFDAGSNKPLAGVKVYLYAEDGVTLAPGINTANPVTTGADGIYFFEGGMGNVRLAPQLDLYEHPTRLSDAELPAGRAVLPASRGEAFALDGITVWNADLPMDATSMLFKVDKAANKSEVKVGEVVTYTVNVENLSDGNGVENAWLEDMIPPGFKFLGGRILVDGVPGIDPASARPLSFSIGSFSAGQKKSIRYQLVVGTGIAPGTYENQAHMKYLTGQVISNNATATVKVAVDPLFDAGTVFGKVFYDYNENGVQDAPDYVEEDRSVVTESPVPSVRIVMEDGTTVTTDKNGQFHIPGLLEGRHLLRVDERTLPDGAYLTTDKVQVVDVTPGGSLKVNFGVNVDNTAANSEDARFFSDKVRLDRDQGQPKPRLNVDAFNPQILLRNDALVDRLEFRIFMNYAPFIHSWKLDIMDRDTKKVVRTFSGTPYDIGAPVFWDGRDSDGKYVRSTRNYSYVLKVEDEKGVWDETAEKFLTVKVMTDEEWTARGRPRTEKERSDETISDDRSHRDWALAQARQDATLHRRIFVKGETLRLSPSDVSLRQVRVLKGGKLFIDVPVIRQHGATAREVVDGVPQKDEPVEIILPDGDYEIEVVSAESSSGGTTDAPVSGPAEVPEASGALKPDLAAAAAGRKASGERAAPVEKGAVTLQHRKPLTVGEDYMMFVALGDGKVGYNINKGNIEPVKSADKYRPGFYQEGKMAYYLKGKIQGKYLVTSSFDTQRQQKEMFRGLKPDDYYPVYGDASSVNYDATNTQGPLYLLVEWDKSQAILGNYAIDFKDTEFANYSRTLYGGKIDYTSVGTTPFGDAKRRVVVFHAEVRQRSAHNELLGTGGSLYYLKHQALVAGSDKVHLEVRDAVTGQMRSRVDMRQGVDYDIDYSEGRILFWQPIAMAARGGSIISDDLLNGDPVYVVADYEYEVEDKIAEGTQGARIAEAVTDHVVVGTTLVSETKEGGDYQLTGQDVTVRLSKDAAVRDEYAETRARDSADYLSTDGGLTYSEMSGSSAVKGRAYGLSHDARLFERVGLRSYYKWIDPGFSVADNASGQGRELKGFAMTFDLTPVTRLTAGYDVQKLIDQGTLATQLQVGASETRTTALQIIHEARRLKLTMEYRNQQVTGQDGSLQTAANSLQSTAAVQAEYAVDEKTGVSIKHQAEVQGAMKQATTVGVTRQITDKLSGSVEETVSSDGTATKAGLTANVTPKLALTTDYSLTSPAGAPAFSTATVGAKGTLNDSTALEASYGVTTAGAAGRGVATLGGSMQVDGSTVKAGAETGVDEAGRATQGLLLDASKTTPEGLASSSSVRVDDTVDGQKTTVAFKEIGRFEGGPQMGIERNITAGPEGLDQTETYSLFRDKDGRKTGTTYGRKIAEGEGQITASNIFGLSGDINDKWAANAQLEKGTIQNADRTITQRTALSAGLGYVSKDPETGETLLTSSTKAEVRIDKGDVNKRQIVGYQSVEGKVNDATTLSARVEGSETRDMDTGKIEAKYKEIVLGAAIRPIASDRLNLFGRYTYKENQKPEGQENTTNVDQNRMHVLAAEGAYDINEDWQVVERIAYRIMEEKVEGFDFAKTHTWLLINRANYRINKDWKLGAEYRIMTQREAKDQKRGFLIEAVRGVNDNVELGVGYNFTDFIDDLTNLDYTVQGPFIRMTGKLYDRTPEEKARAKTKWIERRIEIYAWKMVKDEFARKDSPVVLELNRMYQMASVASDLGQFEESRAIYKDVILVTQMMFEEAASFVRTHIAFEERLYNASQRAREYYDKGEYWMARKLWEKIVEEAEKAVIQ